MSLSLVVASVVNGQLISRTGRYKVLLVTGVAALAVGFLLLGQMGTATTHDIIVRNMVIVGLGLGMVMQTFTLIVQNAVDHAEMGIATAATQLSRSIGGTLGIALLGTILFQSLRDQIAQTLPPGAPGLGSAGSGQAAGALLDPGQLAQLPAPVVSAIREALAVAIHDVFTTALLFVGVAFVAVVLLRELPLRRHTRFQAEEAGRELLLELGQSDADHELIDEEPEDQVAPGQPRLAPAPAAPPRRDSQRR